MILFPVLNILDGNAVSLDFGVKDTARNCGSPLLLAEKWQNEGAEAFHIIDLNAAFDGFSMNLLVLKNISDILRIPFQIGGGIRSLDKIDYYINELGADRVVLGTAAILAPDFLEAAIRLFGADRIVVACDSKNGKVAIKGWLEEKDTTPLQIATLARNLGCNKILYTDIDRVGTLNGINIAETKRLQDKSGLNVIASGGIKCIEDVKALCEAGIYGAVVGKALLDGDISLAEALAITKA
ncbi:MAG: 1-(5-phosphoribosyl)-5-[(5-phosphoribosylamino)methylideneamino] imidazole-4-carboxamide isomerase [Clostridia bacterium]|nr:1-(5-phosphoribosyl)-5-[(5-phosphoribosylamino)methylideneamino] imidazole-4-carboxamide isomerase [Clostridia bacterium]